MVNKGPENIVPICTFQLHRNFLQMVQVSNTIKSNVLLFHYGQHVIYALFFSLLLAFSCFLPSIDCYNLVGFNRCAASVEHPQTSLTTTGRLFDTNGLVPTALRCQPEI